MRAFTLVAAMMSVGAPLVPADAVPTKRPQLRVATISMPSCAKARDARPRSPCMTERPDPFAARNRPDRGRRYLPPDTGYFRDREAERADAELRLKWLKVTASMRF